MSRYDDHVPGPISPTDSWGGKRDAFYGLFPNGNHGARFEVKEGMFDFKSHKNGEIISIARPNFPAKSEQAPILISYQTTESGVVSEVLVELKDPKDAVHLPGGVNVSIVCESDFSYQHEIPETYSASELEGPLSVHRTRLRHADPIISSLAPGDVSLNTGIIVNRSTPTHDTDILARQRVLGPQ